MVCLANVWRNNVRRTVLVADAEDAKEIRASSAWDAGP